MNWFKKGSRAREAGTGIGFLLASGLWLYAQTQIKFTDKKTHLLLLYFPLYGFLKSYSHFEQACAHRKKPVGHLTEHPDEEEATHDSRTQFFSRKRKTKVQNPVQIEKSHTPEPRPKTPKDGDGAAIWF